MTADASARTAAGGPAAEPGTQANGPARAEALAQEVRRRHVFYVPGYDPRDPSLYRRLAALELRRFAKIWGVSVEVDREDVADPAVPSLSWGARLADGDMRVETTYETLRWDDFVVRDFAAPLWLTLLRSAKTGAVVILTGVLWRIWRASPWCAVAWFYPMLTVLLLFALSVAAGVGVANLAVGPGAPLIGAALGLAAGSAVMIGVVAALRRSGSFLVHLIDDGRSQRRYAARADAALDVRVDAFAERISSVVRAGAADEVLVVGHSSGSFVAIDAIARAYEAEPGFAAGRDFALLTVGASELLVAFHPRAGWFRERVRRLSIEPSLFWAEVVGPWDTLNFPHRDPVTELGLDAPADRPNPTFRRAYLTKMLGRDSIATLQKGWRVFRAHFQFVMANEIRGPYDYYSLVLGPWTARSQFARTADGRLMSPKVEPAPPPLPRPDWMPPLPTPKG